MTKSPRKSQLLSNSLKILILILLLFSKGDGGIDQKLPCLANWYLTIIGPPSCSLLPAQAFITGPQTRTPVILTRTMLPFSL